MRRSISRTFSRYSPILRRSWGPTFASQAGGFLHHSVEDAAVAFDPRHPVFGGTARPEHPLEHFARVDLHGQRRGVRPPGERVHVNAAVVAVAGADQAGMVFNRQLHRGKDVVLPDGLRGDLIRGHARVCIAALGGLGPDAAQPSGRAERMDRGGIGRAMSAAADDGQAVAEGFQRLQNPRDLIAGAFGRGSPLVHDRAVGHVDESQARPGRSSGLPGQSLRRNHGIEQRERHGDAHSA